MSDNSDPSSAHQTLQRGAQQRDHQAWRDSLFGGRNAGHWESAPISDTKSIVISCAGAGLMIGMLCGAISAPSNDVPLLQGFLLGAAKGAGIGTAFGFALAKTAALTGFSLRSLRDFDDAHGKFLFAAWKGAKRGLIAGLAVALISRHWDQALNWSLLAAALGAGLGAGIRFYKGRAAGI